MGEGRTAASEEGPPSSFAMPTGGGRPRPLPNFAPKSPLPPPTHSGRGASPSSFPFHSLHTFSCPGAQTLLLLPSSSSSFPHPSGPFSLRSFECDPRCLKCSSGRALTSASFSAAAPDFYVRTVLRFLPSLPPSSFEHTLEE